jgi:hypothetical protein
MSAAVRDRFEHLCADTLDEVAAQTPGSNWHQRVSNACFG